MLLNKVNCIVTNADMKKMTDGTDYCAVGILCLDDGQKFDVSCRDAEIYSKLKAMSKASLDLALTNSKYGLKLNIIHLLAVGDRIA